MRRAGAVRVTPGPLNIALGARRTQMPRAAWRELASLVLS